MAGATVGELAREMAAGRVDHLITGSLFRKIRDVKSKLDLINTDGALDALTEYIRRDATSNAALRAVAQVSLPAAPVSHAAGFLIPSGQKVANLTRCDSLSTDRREHGRPDRDRVQRVRVCDNFNGPWAAGSRGCSPAQRRRRRAAGQQPCGELGR